MSQLSNTNGGFIPLEITAGQRGIKLTMDLTDEEFVSLQRGLRVVNVDKLPVQIAYNVVQLERTLRRIKLAP